MTNVEFAAGLRELADLYERHPEMLRPYSDQLTLWLIYGAKAEDVRATIKALADGGKVEKIGPSDPSDPSYKVHRVLPSGLTVELNADRRGICKKVRKMVMADVWECPDSILDPVEETA